MPRFLVFGGLVLALSVPGAGAPQTAEPKSPSPRLTRLPSAGPSTPLTLLPIRLGGRPLDRVTEVLGLLLEQRGMTVLDLGKVPVDPGGQPDLPQLGLQVAAFVKKEPITSPFALYAEFNGSPQTGLNELRAVLVNQAGEVLWTKRLGVEDAALRDGSLRNPMGFSMVLADQMGPLFGLDEATAKAAKPGPMARRMEERSGLPPEGERLGIPDRLSRMKAAGVARTLTVYPARLGGNLDPAGAGGLVAAMSGSGLGRVIPGSADLLLKSPQRDPNEQKVLWDLARAFREHLRKNPPASDYALYVDCVFNPGNWEQGYVHVVVCDRAGEWVIVDFQNAHHADYQALKPASAEACRALVVKRLQGHLR